MRLRGSSRGGSLDPASIRLPIIALIDVVLFLLMYFMIAGTLGGEEKQLSSALGTEGGTGGASRDLAPQILTVEVRDGSAHFRIGQHTTRDREELRGLLSALPREPGVAVRAAPDAPVAATAAAIQACKDAGFEKISFVAPR